MPGKIFINYRRDDVPGDARGVRDGLAARFGKANVFMDVDNLLVGQRFDVELAKALDACDMLIAVIGPRWMDLLKDRMAGAERDYVREEIAAALARKITVIPVRVGREGSMPALPRRDDLPEDIRDLVLHQKLDVAHERFGRDMAELNGGIVAVRKALAAGERTGRPVTVPWRWVGAGVMGVLAIGYVGAARLGVPLWLPWQSAKVSQAVPGADDASRAAEAARVKAAADRLAEAEATLAVEQKARAKAEARAKQLADAADKARRDQEARERAARDEAERQRLASLKAEEDRKRTVADAMHPGHVFRDCNDGCPEMVVIPDGKFMMGEGSARHEVSIARPFAVAKFEVTFDEWAACVAGGGCKSNRNPSDRGWGNGRRPVINVSWNDAQEYVAWLSRRTDQIYRLLTEAEWEYAARAGTTTLYSWGEDIGKGNANCFGCGSQWDNKQTAPVGSFKANPWGLHDMHGNVWEWCEEAHDSSSRVIRGGSWFINPKDLRSSGRFWNVTDGRNLYIGFRVARVLSSARPL